MLSSHLKCRLCLYRIGNISGPRYLWTLFNCGPVNREKTPTVKSQSGNLSLFCGSKLEWNAFPNNGKGKL